MDTQIGCEQLRYAVWTVSYSNQIPSGYAQNRIWADSLNEALDIPFKFGVLQHCSKDFIFLHFGSIIICYMLNLWFQKRLQCDDISQLLQCP